MKRYTKEQLIKGQTLYNKDWLENPQNFTYKSDNPEDLAIKQVNYLLQKIEQIECVKYEPSRHNKSL